MTAQFRVSQSRIRPCYFLSQPLHTAFFCLECASLHISYLTEFIFKFPQLLAKSLLPTIFPPCRSPESPAVCTTVQVPLLLRRLPPLTFMHHILLKCFSSVEQKFPGGRDDIQLCIPRHPSSNQVRAWHRESSIIFAVMWFKTYFLKM